VNLRVKSYYESPEHHDDDAFDIAETVEEFYSWHLNHSLSFSPLSEEDKRHIEGILLAKDLLALLCS